MYMSKSLGICQTQQIRQLTDQVEKITKEKWTYNLIGILRSMLFSNEQSHSKHDVSINFLACSRTC